MELDNLIIGQNIARIRKLKDIKAFDIAAQVGLKEAAYTKYERGETSITIDFINKVAVALEVDPLLLLSATPAYILEHVHSNPTAVIQQNSSFSGTSPQQAESMLKLMESLTLINERLLTLLEKGQK
ncbi:MAG: helix-turn-helix transcriptional regulator [Agriterribacter sp.]